VLHRSPSSGPPRILFVPNWPVVSEHERAGHQTPDFYPVDGRYWFFRHFEMPVSVDVLDTRSWPGWHLEEKAIRFYAGQNLRALAIAAEYDLIFPFGAQSAVGMLAAWRILGKSHPPVLVDDAGCLNAGRPDRPFSFQTSRWAMSEAQHIVWHSSSSLALCQRRCPELAAKGEFLPFGINLEDLGSVVVRDGNYALCAGNSPRSWDSVVDAWSAFPKRQLLLLGSPLVRAQLPANVHAVPRLPFHQYLRLLAGARVVLLPLPDGWASWGQMTLLQAMGLGKPTVVTNVRPIIDYVRDGCMVVCGRNPQGMVDAVDRVWTDVNLRRELGAAAKHAVLSRFGEAGMALAVERAVRETLGTSSD
jgi:glycosyltransferase involved in cell wall biosynthesis